MSIDKALSSVPIEAEAITVTIVPDDEASTEGAVPEENNSPEFDENLAEVLPESVLQTLGSDLIKDVEDDERSRKEWLDTYIKGLQLLGLKYEERSEPWPGACGVFHPLLMEAAVKFQSETIMETFPAAGPVRTVIIGKETTEKKEAAARVEADMNYELTEVMQEYRPEHERMLLSVALAGNAFKKIYFDPSLNRQVAPYLPAEDVIVPYGAMNIQSAERITHKMRKTENELYKLQAAGFYRDIDLGKPMRVMDEVEKRKAEQQGFSASMDERYQLYEIHCNIDLEHYEDKDKDGNKTGIKLPYVVTVEKGTGTVLAIRRNWLDGDHLKLRRQHFVHYGYIPGFGFYYFGLIHLIGGHTKAATSLLRQLVDAGTLSNLPGGLKAKGLRIKGDDTPIAPGEFRDVDLMSGTIRDNILPLPYKEPSQVLVGLMDKIVEDGRRFAGSTELNVSDMSSQAPVGTTLAVLERALKVMGAIQARIHYTMKQEFRLLAAIIRDNTSQMYGYDPETGDPGAKQEDYDSCDILPVSDPNVSTMAQRVVQYQAVMQLAQSAPHIYNLPFLHRQMIETLGVKNAAKLVPMHEDMQPVDPISENMFILMGQPVKAFMYQDHDAHIAAHMAMKNDPLMQQMVGQNPQAQAIMAAGAAHLMEHLAYKYRKDIEKQLGAPYPAPPDLEKEEGYMPPDVEVQVSQLAAQAAQQLLQQNQATAQQQKAQQQAQDPLIQMQQQELQIKQQQVQIEAQKAQMEAQIAQAEMQLKQQVAQMEAQIATLEQDRKSKKDVLDAANSADELNIKKMALQLQHEAKGMQLGADIAHKKATHLTDTAHKADQHELEQSKHHLEAVKTGVDIGNKKAETKHKHSVHQADVAHKQGQQDLEERNLDLQEKQAEQQAQQGVSNDADGSGE